MKNFTNELKSILKEDPGVPILSPDEVRKRANTMVILTNEAPKELLAIAGSSRKAILVNYKPLMITFPDERGVYKVQADDIVFENHHSGRDVTEAGSQETSYEKFFAAAMKKFNVSSPIELSPDETKKFFNYVDKNWKADEESDGSKTEILPAIGAVAGGLARGAMAVGRMAAGAAGATSALGDENESGWEDPPKLGGEPSLITPMENDENEAQQARAPIAGKAMQKAAQQTAASFAANVVGDDNEDVSTGKVGKKDKGSYQHAYKLALKKYKIHSADELDTPAERKGFTAYVDRLWKGGEVHESGCSCESCVVNEVSREVKAQRKAAAAKETEKRDKEAPQQSDADKKREEDRRQKEIKKKIKKQKQKRAAKVYRDELDKKLDQKRKEKEQQRKARDDEQQKQDDKDDKDDKADAKMSLGGALSKIGGAAQGALSKYKSSGR